jgi:hypothetical protein
MRPGRRVFVPPRCSLGDLVLDEDDRSGTPTAHTQGAAQISLDRSGKFDACDRRPSCPRVSEVLLGRSCARRRLQVRYVDSPYSGRSTDSVGLFWLNRCMQPGRRVLASPRCSSDDLVFGEDYRAGTSTAHSRGAAPISSGDLVFDEDNRSGTPTAHTRGAAQISLDCSGKFDTCDQAVASSRLRGAPRAILCSTRTTVYRSAPLLSCSGVPKKDTKPTNDKCCRTNIWKHARVRCEAWFAVVGRRMLVR